MLAKNILPDLKSLVLSLIVSEPYMCDGYAWAAKPQEWYATALKCSVATIRSVISKEPFVRLRAVVAGRTWTLLRIGKDDPTTEKHVANTLKLIFLDHMKFLEASGMLNAPATQADGAPAQKPKKLFTARKTVTKSEYGCLIGLAKQLPQGEQAKIFRYVLKNWPVFMSAVGVKVFEANLDADLKGEPAPFSKRFYNFPSIGVIVKHHDCAIEAYSAAKAGLV